ncbi:tRNA (guanine37-N1)-methyltransferase [Eubacterium ruminantium]|nr:tRNA (guanine37-N1)-methyltransferase [Eubacterium ruminantium]
MRFHVLTLFPEMMQMIFSSSVTGKAMGKGIVSLETINIRDFADNKYKHIDDYIYGGGSGMLMQARPVYESYLAALESCKDSSEKRKQPRVLYTTPQGRTFDQRMAEELSKEDDIIILCGHYEGIDERAIELIKPEEVSIGDFVLTGGELPAAVIMDSVTRLLPGALGKDDSAVYESFYDNLLEYPQYTRPEEYMGLKVPEVLLSGHHKNIEKWRLEEAEKRTKEKRPDLYEIYEQEKLKNLKNQKKR